MSSKIAIRNVEIRTPENAPFDLKAVCAAVLDGVKRVTGLPVMITVDPEPRLAKGDTPTYSDPRELVARREKALDRQRFRSVPFNALCYGTKFKYDEADQALFVKIGHNTVAQWDARNTANHWVGQGLFSAFDADADLTRSVWLLEEVGHGEAEKQLRDHLSEVQRLNDRLDASNETIEFAATQKVEQQKVSDALMADAKRFRSERDTLYAHLVEVHALLRDCRWRIVNKDTSTADYLRLDKPVVGRIDAALSATTEPSAPAERQTPGAAIVDAWQAREGGAL